MRPQASRVTTVGLVIALSLTLAAFGILSVGRERGFFRSRTHFTTDFPNVDGLSIGSPVRLVGVQVGVVTAIDFPEDIAKPEVDVTFGVDTTYRDRIREGTTATLKNLTYLSGEKYIEVTPGRSDRPTITEGGYIESPRGEFEQLMVSSQTIARNIEDISSQLRELLVHLNSGESVLSQLILNPEFGQQAVEDAGRAVERFDLLLGDLEKGRGLAGRLLRDEGFADRTVKSLTSTLERFESIVARLDSDQGVLAQIGRDDSDLTRGIADLRAAAGDFRALTASLKAGEGLAGRLLTDRGLEESVASRLETLIEDLAAVVRKVNEGEGTLGRLLNDAELYDQATDVVGGVADSRFLRWVARRVRDRRLKSQIEELVRQTETAEKQGPPSRPAAPPGS